jgi:SLA1 homology domain 1, SHD1
MRAFMLAALLLAAPAYADERTWTISTGTYAMAAELVEVRGDIAYLKTGDRIEHIPLARLSAADMQYIAALSPARIFPGPADEPVQESIPSPAAGGATGVASEYNAAPPTGPVLIDPKPAVQTTTQKPVLNPATRPQDFVRAQTQAMSAEEMLPAPQTTNQPKSRVIRAAPRTLSSANGNNAYVRRPPTNQRQNQNYSPNRNRSNNNNNNNEGFGLFGRRSRR